MSKFQMMSVAVVGMSFGLGGSVQAGDCGYVTKTITVYEPVICYETRTVPYDVCVTRYDHCGNPYTAHVTKYKTVEVKVVKQVPVTKCIRVQVCEY